MEVLGCIILEPSDEPRSFLSQADSEKSVDGERRIPNPGKTVIPVASTTNHLGETGGRSGEDGSGRLERKKLQRQSGSLHLLAPTSAVGAGGEPRVPESDGLTQQFFGFLFRRRARNARLLIVRCEKENLRLPFFEPELADNASMSVQA